jgi:hypothetical protein
MKYTEWKYKFSQFDGDDFGALAKAFENFFRYNQSHIEKLQPLQILQQGFRAGFGRGMSWQKAKDDNKH